MYENNDGEQAIRDYISSVHGPGSDCPHPRVLPNLVSICVAAIFHRQVISLAFANPLVRPSIVGVIVRSFFVRRFEMASRVSSNEDKPPSLPPLRCYLLVLNVA